MDEERTVTEQRRTKLGARLATLMHEACRKIAALEHGGDIIRQGASFGGIADDTEIRADAMLAEHFADGLTGVPGIAEIVCEGYGARAARAGDAYVAYVDPLDGSLDYLSRGRTLGLPYSAAITVVPPHGSFSDIVAAQVMDLRATREKDLFEAYRSGPSGMPWALHRLAPARTNEATELDLRKQIVLGEMYYPENRERLARAFQGEKGWLRNPGSAAYEMALVAAGVAVAYICDRQKNHELGAGYLLVTGAGGVGVDLDGRDLGSRQYDFTAQTPVILAANQAIADQILTRLHRP